MTPKLMAHEPVMRVERIGLVLGLGLAAVLMWPFRHFVTDDTFVHLQFARHLAQSRGPVFNPGEHVYGCTSPLWAAFLADAMALGWNGLIVARIIGYLSALATIPMFLQLMRRTVRLPELRAFATVTWSVNAWMMQWATSGMETSLAVALMLAGFVAFTEGKQWGSRPVRTGALWALAALTRPEMVFLLLLWGITMLIDTNNRVGLRRMVFGIVPPALIYGGWLLFARFFFGTFWPRTLVNKAEHHTGFDLGQLLAQIQVMAQTDGVLMALLVAGLVFGGRRIWGQPVPAQRMLPWLWLLSLPLLYVARGIPANPRYLLLLLPVLEWLAWRTADAWWLGPDPVPLPRRAQATVFGFAVMALSVLVNLGVYRTTVAREVERSTMLIRGSLVQWGDWFARHAPPGSTIAAREVGALGYRSGRHVLDLTAVLSPELEPYLRDVADPIAQFSFASVARPTFLVDRAPRAFDLLERSPHAAALTPLGRAPAPVARDRADSVYTFYRIDWAVFDNPAAAPPPAAR